MGSSQLVNTSFEIFDIRNECKIHKRNFNGSVNLVQRGVPKQIFIVNIVNLKGNYLISAKIDLGTSRIIVTLE